MRKKGKHLTWNDRLMIERMLRKKYSKKEIAEVIGCCLATIYNEIKRAQYWHTGEELKEELRYNPDEAQRKYESNLKKKGSKPKLQQDTEIAKYIEYMIAEQKYSPAAVLMQIEVQGLDFDVTIKSVNTIYAAIKKGYFPMLTVDYLPQRRRKHKKGRVVIQKRASKGTSIEKREKKVLRRETFGDWEMDCVIGKPGNSKTLLVFTERKTRYEIIEVLKTHTSGEVVKALNRIEKRYGSSFFDIFKTITVDNGSEFADYEGMEKALYRVGNRTKIYYCHPSAPHERGSNEVCNKLIRRFYPRGTDFDKVINKKQVKDVEFWVNTYPRKIFNGACALEMFEAELAKLGYDTG